MTIPGKPYQDAHVNASVSPPPHVVDRNHGRGSHSGDGTVRDMAALTVGVHTGHAIHRCRRRGIHGRILLPLSHHGGAPAAADGQCRWIGCRHDGPVERPIKVAGWSTTNPGAADACLMSVLLLSGLVAAAVISVPPTATAIPILRRARIMGVAGIDSLHHCPVPRGCGLAIVLTASLAAWAAVLMATRGRSPVRVITKFDVVLTGLATMLTFVLVGLSGTVFSLSVNAHPVLRLALGMGPGWTVCSVLESSLRWAPACSGDRFFWRFWPPSPAPAGGEQPSHPRPALGTSGRIAMILLLHLQIPSVIGAPNLVPTPHGAG